MNLNKCKTFIKGEWNANVQEVQGTGLTTKLGFDGMRCKVFEIEMYNFVLKCVLFLLLYHHVCNTMRGKHSFRLF